MLFVPAAAVGAVGVPVSSAAPIYFVALIFPLTSSFSVGCSTPIPTGPEPLELVFKTRGLLVFVLPVT